MKTNTPTKKNKKQNPLFVVSGKGKKKIVEQTNNKAEWFLHAIGLGSFLKMVQTLNGQGFFTLMFWEKILVRIKDAVEKIVLSFQLAAGMRAEQAARS